MKNKAHPVPQPEAKVLEKHQTKPESPKEMIVKKQEAPVLVKKEENKKELQAIPLNTVVGHLVKEAKK